MKDSMDIRQNEDRLDYSAGTESPECGTHRCDGAKLDGKGNCMATGVGCEG